MGALDVKTKIYSTIDAMPLESLDAVLAFLEDLQRSSEDETVMLMREPGFMRDYQEAKKDIRTGTTVSLKAIRRVTKNKHGRLAGSEAGLNGRCYTDV